MRFTTSTLGMCCCAYVARANYRRSGTYCPSRDFKKEYPDAKLIGVRPLLNKRQDLPWNGGMGMIIQQNILIIRLIAYGHDPKDTEYGFESEVLRDRFYSRCPPLTCISD